MILKIFYHSRETTRIKDMTCNSKDSIDVKNTTRMMSYKILNLLVTAIIKVISNNNMLQKNCCIGIGAIL